MILDILFNVIQNIILVKLLCLNEIRYKPITLNIKNLHFIILKDKYLVNSII